MRWNFGSVYRRIFSLVYLANIITLVVLIARYAISADRSKFTYQQASIAVTGNILAVVTVRNEHMVNGMFWVFGTWSKNLPLGFRTLAAKVYSYGGIHSAGAVSATFWYITFLVLLTMEFQKAESLTVSRSYIYLVSYVILLLLVSMLVSAHPHLRRTMHNWFEGIHRCMGWLAILLFWAQAMLLAVDSTQTSGTSFGKTLLVSPNFWMLIPITLLIAYPWTRLRLRPVEAEVLSQHCVKLNFTYRNVHFGQAVRLTDAPLRETHAFGVIPFPAVPAPMKHDQGSTDYTHTEKGPLPSKENNNNHSDYSHDSNPSLAALKHHALTSPTTAGQLTHAGERGFSVIISNAGDWTKKIIACPPTHIYTRAPRTPDHPVRIIWSTKDPVKTYGRQVVELVYKTDPRPW
ncbi:hypothetical protein NEMBOFW57_006326 [Staphylotrichum longicolle]|uniref:Uncharacterized protein n=1 Tax=Staphylotrichum longicolle TaxID=669026 RepID=A0AAD4EYP8_9PEZI|nr:hypothetical protein NEMBOFW57_006326 [Staphylotrichum longicolle]